MTKLDGIITRLQAFGDRYHAHLLRTPTEARRTLRYVRQNAVKHGVIARAERDAYASPAAKVDLPPPRTWLLRLGWRRALNRTTCR